MIPHNTVIIHSMGRVGSVSIDAALHQANVPTLFAHYMFLGEQGQYNTHKPLLVEEIHKKDRRWKVVSIVREPISRNMSAFFQRLDFFYPRYNGMNYTPEIEATFLNKFEHYWPLIFFDVEFKPVFQLDVYQGKFPHKKGYKIYHGEYVDLLILRTENLDRCITKAFADFGIPNIQPVQRLNATSRKEDKVKLYTVFRYTASLPAYYIDWMHKSRYAEYFYSKKELNLFRSYWATK